MPPFVDQADLPPKELLVAAVSYLQEIVDRTLEGRFIRQSLLSYLRSAWADIRGSGQLERIRGRIRDVQVSILAEHGLTGVQLEMKRQTIREWDRLFRRRPGPWSLKRLLGGLRSLFESLLDALGLGGLLKEFLDFLMDAIEGYGESIRT